MPFFIDWLECAHPADTNPNGGQFTSLAISHPEADGLNAALKAIGLDIAVSAGEPSLSLEIETANGTVTLASTAETTAIAMR